MLVNTSGTLGGIGASTNLVPALTLGCGAVGGSSTSDNIGVENLFNLRRVAYGVRDLEEIRQNLVKHQPHLWLLLAKQPIKKN